jgi:hypothetical protein
MHILNNENSCFRFLLRKHSLNQTLHKHFAFTFNQIINEIINAILSANNKLPISADFFKLRLMI